MFMFLIQQEQIKFDSVAYLSDQPLVIRPFLQHFVETQMFATFIDEAGKTLTKKQRSYFNETNMVDSMYIYEDDYEEMDFTIYSDKMIEARVNNAQVINLAELEDLPSSASLLPVVMSPCKKRLQVNLSGKAGQVKSIPSSPAKMVSTALTAQTNWKVVESLLREVKVRTKRILLAKMGSDDLGHHSSSPSNYEENTLIAALCDLIERIWSHARSDDYDGSAQWESSKCPLWSHLTAFHEFQQQQKDDKEAEREEAFRRRSRQTTPDEDSDANSGVTWTSLKKRIDCMFSLC